MFNNYRSGEICTNRIYRKDTNKCKMTIFDEVFFNDCWPNKLIV